MYLPKQFQVDDVALALDIMRENPFASLISTDDTGLPFVTHLPIHCERHPNTENERSLARWMDRLGLAPDVNTFPEN